jgi:hypothetical protein
MTLPEDLRQDICDLLIDLPEIREIMAAAAKDSAAVTAVLDDLEARLRKLLGRLQ